MNVPKGAQNVVTKATYGMNAKKEQSKGINCMEEHSTLAMKCSKRKMILKEKRKKEIERQKITFSDISRVQISIPPQVKTSHFTVPQITKEETLKIHICVAHAHYKNLGKPGTYGENLIKS